VTQQRIVELVDDLDGQPAAETLQLRLDGIDYEIDLSEANAAKLRTVLQEFIQNARQVNGRRRAKAKPQVQRPTANDAAKIRTWAQEQGLKVSARGRISADLRKLYQEAQAAPRHLKAVPSPEPAKQTPRQTQLPLAVPERVIRDWFRAQQRPIKSVTPKRRTEYNEAHANL
jgi:hypothetical protein